MAKRNQQFVDVEFVGVGLRIEHLLVKRISYNSAANYLHVNTKGVLFLENGPFTKIGNSVVELIFDRTGEKPKIVTQGGEVLTIGRYTTINLPLKLVALEIMPRNIVASEGFVGSEDEYRWVHSTDLFDNSSGITAIRFTPCQ